jgi:hypothetical protein
MNLAAYPISPDSSKLWVEYFERHRGELAPIPWHEGVTLTPAERDAIATSIQEFQVGESSEGRHLFTAAQRYAAHSGDGDYVTALRLFVAEEHRHAADLGRVMDLSGIPRASKSWPDTVFRFLRRRAGLELSVSVLVTAEVIAKVYYPALRDATRSTVLRTLCEQIIRDEVVHVRFQCERLAILRQRRRGVRLAVTLELHRVLFFGTCLVVWRRHGRAMRAGGLGFGSFWRRGWDELRDALRIADPRQYATFPDPPTSTVGGGFRRARSVGFTGFTRFSGSPRGPAQAVLEAGEPGPSHGR